MHVNVDAAAAAASQEALKDAGSILKSVTTASA